MILEIYKDIPNFEGLYQVSNLGNVKSLYRVLLRTDGQKITRQEKILKQTLSRGYLTIGLCKNNIKESRFVHVLVAMVFHNHKPCGHKLVVNHKDFNKLNNCADNLEITTQRENSNQKHLPSSSKYVGVCWYGARNKWIASIRINGRSKHLGYFVNEIEASNAYQSKLKSIA